MVQIIFAYLVITWDSYHTRFSNIERLLISHQDFVGISLDSIIVEGSCENEN
jgi:hypothetical protein